MWSRRRGRRRCWGRKGGRVGDGKRSGVGVGRERGTGGKGGYGVGAGDEAGDGAEPDPPSKPLPHCLWRKCSGANVANSSNHCFVVTAVRTMAPAIDCVVLAGRAWLLLPHQHRKWKG